MNIKQFALMGHEAGETVLTITRAEHPGLCAKDAKLVAAWAQRTYLPSDTVPSFRTIREAVHLAYTDFAVALPDDELHRL
jgi:hypothetical protein